MKWGYSKINGWGYHSFKSYLKSETIDYSPLCIYNGTYMYEPYSAVEWKKFSYHCKEKAWNYYAHNDKHCVDSTSACMAGMFYCFLSTDLNI